MIFLRFALRFALLVFLCSSKVLKSGLTLWNPPLFQIYDSVLQVTVVENSYSYFLRLLMNGPAASVDGHTWSWFSWNIYLSCSCGFQTDVYVRPKLLKMAWMDPVLKIYVYISSLCCVCVNTSTAYDKVWSTLLKCGVTITPKVVWNGCHNNHTKFNVTFTPSRVVW